MAHTLQVGLGMQGYVYAPGKRNLRPAATRRHSRLRAAAIGVTGALGLVACLWLGVRYIGWFGPALANGLRSVIGADAVTWLEEVGSVVEDHWTRLLKHDSAPKSYWETPAGVSAPDSFTAPASSATNDAGPSPSEKAVTPFRPADVGPLDARVAAAGDGTWLAVPDARAQSEERLIYNLQSDEVRTWGAALGGDAIIRRSAVGLSADAETLYVAISNYTSAGAIARSVRHAGAVNVAQLDVNWSYPKIVVFRRGASDIVESTGLFPGFFFEPAEYLRTPSKRDFFYVVRENVERTVR